MVQLRYQARVWKIFFANRESKFKIKGNTIKI